MASDERDRGGYISVPFFHALAADHTAVCMSLYMVRSIPVFSPIRVNDEMPGRLTWRKR